MLNEANIASKQLQEDISCKALFINTISHVGNLCRSAVPNWHPRWRKRFGVMFSGGGRLVPADGFGRPVSALHRRKQRLRYQGATSFTVWISKPWLIPASAGGGQSRLYDGIDPVLYRPAHRQGKAAGCLVTEAACSLYSGVHVDWRSSPPYFLSRLQHPGEGVGGGGYQSISG